ncbi:thioredoxin domain-containing protein [Chloropicon primus]|uniref:Thioredoxin domain-containing protein n=1 Tax=Chloropicon primus TaxID=1764295 RepID=A0A5B8MXI4_9CHLO|nr:hypothetical protein A3770_17p80360 [Chloropicon primus]UPR04715.1 thioredoxin domain-containing protein [Chloropicon primus]|eukprot:QDZ25518.1 hypothetical protein A3770_17p80360 [Chloropicon primus]
MGNIGRFLQPYYLFNALILLSYPLARFWAMNTRGLRNGLVHTESEVISWEKQAFSLLGIITVVKFIKRQSLDSFFSDFFMFMKVAVAVLAFVLDVRLFSWYWMVYTIMFVLLQQPRYAGPSKFTHYTPASLHEAVNLDDGVSRLIEFHAAWSPPCLHLEPAMAELSVKYTKDDFKFGKFDVGRWPYVGEGYKVSTSAIANQLPTLILFKGGKEVARIPHVFKDGSFVKGRYRKKDIIKGFDLDGKSKRKTTAKSKREAKKTR